MWSSLKSFLARKTPRLAVSSLLVVAIAFPLAFWVHPGTANASKRRVTLPYSEFHALAHKKQLRNVVIRGTTAEAEVPAGVPVDSLGTGTTTHVQTIIPSPLSVPPELLAIIEQTPGTSMQVVIPEPPSQWIQIGFNLLNIVLLIGLVVWAVGRSQRGPGGRFRARRASDRVRSSDEAPHEESTTFDDVAGCDEAKAELRDIVDFLKDPTRFERLGGKMPKGALLVGPPGTGKTLLARAVAGEAGCNCLIISASDLVEMYVGVGASRVRQLFADARASAPAVVFIDEIDAVGRKRRQGGAGGGGHEEWEQTLNALLVEMDGFAASEGVVVLAATNRADTLDSALVRPGRFDRQIQVDLPDITGRRAILGVHARSLPLDSAVDLDVIAKMTPGLAGADLAALVNDAALIAAREDAQMIRQQHLELALNKVLMGGPALASRALTTEEKRLVAIHEAGHATCALFLKNADPLYKVTIIPHGRALGVTSTMPEGNRYTVPRWYLFQQLVILWGGRIAEELVMGAENVCSGAAGDIQQATSIARRMVAEFGMTDAVDGVGFFNVRETEAGGALGVAPVTSDRVDAEMRRLLSEAGATCRALLTLHRTFLDDLTAALLQHETVGRDEVEAMRNAYQAMRAEQEAADRAAARLERARQDARDRAPTGLPSVQCSLGRREESSPDEVVASAALAGTGAMDGHAGEPSVTENETAPVELPAGNAGARGAGAARRADEPGGHETRLRGAHDGYGGGETGQTH